MMRHIILDGWLVWVLWCTCLAAQEVRVVSGPLVTSDRWPRASDLVTWTRDVMRIEGLEGASETAQGKAFFEWLRLFCRMAVGGMIQAYEGDYNQERYVTDAHKNLFVYGWGYCDTCSRIAEAAWKEYKQDRAAAERVCVQHDDGGFHTMYRLRLDGRYGAFDPRYGYYLVDRDAPDARVLDWAGVGVDENILRNKTYRYRSRPYFEIFGREWERALLIQPAYFESEDAWRKAGAPKEHVFGNSQYRMGTRLHDMSFRLPKGTVIERFWDNSGRKFYVPAGRHTEREFPFLASGRFYRVAERSLEGNWPKYDPNYQKAKPYLARVPVDEGYPPELAGGRTIGQAWGSIRYQPDLRDPQFTQAWLPDSNLTHSTTAPYLRPARPEAGGWAILDFYSPYVLVGGTLAAELAGPAPDVKLEIRTLRPKLASEGEAEVWSRWQSLPTGAGALGVELGRPRFNGQDVSIHGVYRFQVRLSVEPRAGRTAPPGLNALKVALDFETGIMSIPQIFAGRNTVRFRVQDASLLRGPVRVTYRYATAAGDRVHTKLVLSSDFHANEATYVLDAPGLTWCKSVAVEY